MKSEGVFGKFFFRNEEYVYTIFRVIVGVVFILNGLMKFGLSGKASVPLMSLMGLAGTIEVVGGTLIVIGLWTRFIAAIAGIEMIVAYIMAHAPHGWNPLVNGGEPAVLFFSAFLILLIYGGGKLTVERLIHKKELF